jgi:hypothetical protein
LRGGAVHIKENFDRWEKSGYHITPVHFYSPIPDTRQLKAAYPGPSKISGIDFKQESQKNLIQHIFPKYADEYNAISAQASTAGIFYLNNDAFAGIDPYVYYCMIRHLQPNTIIEIGSGFSTLLGTQAIEKNTKHCTFKVVDPWPREFTQEFLSSRKQSLEYIRKRVEEVDVAFFAQLAENDILFIDTAHVVRTGGDVNFLFLEVLPTLAPGVIIHIHDIFLPDEYPKEWPVDQQRFWSEQYLLQAYLTENDHVEVLFACNWASQVFCDELRETFPKALHIGGGSFWIRKC